MKRNITALSLAILMAASTGAAVQAEPDGSRSDRSFDCKEINTFAEWDACGNEPQV